VTVEWLGTDDAEELPGPPSRPPHRRRLWWVAGAAVVAAVVVAVTLTQSGGSGSRPAVQPTTSAPSPSSPPLEQPAGSLPAGPQPVLLELGHPLLPGASGWELFGRTADAIVRIQVGTGRVTTTSVPEIASSGAVAFIVGPHSVVLRPYDDVSGYVVADGRAAQPLRGLLATITNIFPGPSPDQVWIQGPSGQSAPPAPRMYDWTTNALTNTRLAQVPAALGSPFAPDGSGYLLYSGVGGVYDVRDTGIRRVTTGAVIAAGATSWLTLECDDNFVCSTVLVDQHTGAHTRLGGAPSPQPNYLPGSISPDGRFAAYVVDASSPSERLHIVDLTNFTDRPATVTSADVPYGTQPFVWAPSGHMLLVADNKNTLEVVDPATLSARVLDRRLPPMSQLTIRELP